MAKSKRKHSNLSDYVNNKKKVQQVKSLNKFELHINKEKLRVLGKKSKNDRGIPGISRAKAVQKRKGTLLQEYKLQNKTNKFIDKRIGECNTGLTEDDRAMARFTAIRAKAHKRKSIFNLADDEVLTHKGQTLNAIEKFDDPRSDDEDSLDEQEKSGKLNSDFVEEAHFGGGVLSRTGKDGAKSHKDLINELIAESKKRKAEKQKTKERTLELTEKLDNEWKDLIPLVNKNFKQKGDSTAPKSSMDEYDKVINELRFEARGQPSDRLKTETEIAKEEKEKLERLENDRIIRMKGIFKDNPTNIVNHRSADDLDDDFDFEEDKVMLSYNEEGKCNVELQNEEDEIVNVVTAENEGNNDVSSDEAETESEDDLSDLKAESSESEDEKEEPEPESNSKDTDLQELKIIMEEARKELPYTYNLPESYNEFYETINKQPAQHQCIILERMIKCNHPSLGQTNKEKLGFMFVYLLQYFNDLTLENEPSHYFKVFYYLMPHLYDLAQLNQDNAQHSVSEVLKEKQLEYRKSKKTYPDTNMLLYLKIVICLFPTSDFRHPVVTPSIVFVDQMLTRCKVKTQKDIAYGLFLVTLILEYTALSKRFLPSAINFLGGVLHMAIPKTRPKLLKVIPPFKSSCTVLVLYKNCSSMSLSLKLQSEDLIKTEISEDFKIRAIYTAMKLIQEFIENFKDLPSNIEIFADIFQYLKQLPTGNYPNEVQTLIVDLSDYEMNRKLYYVVQAAQRPKALRLYEPNIQKVYDGKTHKVMSKAKAERAKMLHKIKRERKGALREIRRDRSFLGRVQINQKIQSDKERREKVKRIFAEANIQQSELNAMDRKNKRK